MVDHLVFIKRHRMGRLSVFLLQAMLAVRARDHFDSFFDTDLVDPNLRFFVFGATRSHPEFLHSERFTPAKNTVRKREKAMRSHLPLRMLN
jgi:hypothetical protein